MTASGGADYLLAIESSCDETAASVIDRDRRVLSNVVASQAELHARFGGVVPEIASRAHLRRIIPVVDEALAQAGIAKDQLCAVAAMREPGLVGSLLVGLTAAKTLAWVLDVPLVCVNHVHAHLYACRLSAEEAICPAIGLVVSGGHTNLYDCRSLTDYMLLGSTIDDAAGEAFDKVASILGLGYPGGPAIEAAARHGEPNCVQLPRPMLNSPELAFSFSGLKTAVLYEVRGRPGGPPAPELTSDRVNDVAAEFQEAVIDVLLAKCRQAIQEHARTRLLLGGGVAANSRLRERMQEMTQELGVELRIADRSLCTDNAAMGAIAWEHLDQGEIARLDIDVQPGLIRSGAAH